MSKCCQNHSLKISESNPKEYIETFDNGGGGWFGVISNQQPVTSLDIQDGAVVSSSPWWVDYNHAPPGGGYLHLIMAIMTSKKAKTFQQAEDAVGENRFVQAGFPTDFTDAKLTVRIKGDIDLRGAQICLLIQGTVGKICSGWVLTGQPINVHKDWSEQTITAVCDQSQWTALDSRHDRRESYGTIDLKTILRDINTNIYLVLFPLNVAPDKPIDGDPHKLRAGFDYPVDQSKLPKGNVIIDTVKIEFS
jgi:hypothetical protein